MIHQASLEFRTRGRGTTDITADVQRAVAASSVMLGTWQGCTSMSTGMRGMRGALWLP